MKGRSAPDFVTVVENSRSVTNFDLDMARKTLPWLKKKLGEIDRLGREGELAMARLDMENADELTKNIDRIFLEIRRKGIMIRDFSTALCDFPVVINSMPAYLCWKPDEDSIQFWHYVDEGYAGRKPVTENMDILRHL